MAETPRHRARRPLVEINVQQHCTPHEKVPGKQVLAHYEQNLSADAGLVLTDTRAVGRLLQGGSAHKCQLIKPGDQLITVNGRDVRQLKIEQISAQLMGAPGTLVELILLRQEDHCCRDASPPISSGRWGAQFDVSQAAFQKLGFSLETIAGSLYGVALVRGGAGSFSPPRRTATIISNSKAPIATTTWMTISRKRKEPAPRSTKELESFSSPSHFTEATIASASKVRSKVLTSSRRNCAGKEEERGTQASGQGPGIVNVQRDRQLQRAKIWPYCIIAAALLSVLLLQQYAHSFSEHREGRGEAVASNETRYFFASGSTEVCSDILTRGRAPAQCKPGTARVLYTDSRFFGKGKCVSPTEWNRCILDPTYDFAQTNPAIEGDYTGVVAVASEHKASVADQYPGKRRHFINLLMSFLRPPDLEKKNDPFECWDSVFNSHTRASSSAVASGNAREYGCSARIQHHFEWLLLTQVPGPAQYSGFASQAVEEENHVHDGTQQFLGVYLDEDESFWGLPQQTAAELDLAGSDLSPFQPQSWPRLLTAAQEEGERDQGGEERAVEFDCPDQMRCQLWRRLSRFQILVYDAEGTGHIVGEWRALHTARQQRLLFLPLSTELAVVSSA